MEISYDWSADSEHDMLRAYTTRGPRYATEDDLRLLGIHPERVTARSSSQAEWGDGGLGAGFDAAGLAQLEHDADPASLAALYREGATLDDLRELTGLTKFEVVGLLEEEGVQFKRISPAVQARRRLIARTAHEHPGWKISEIAEHLGLSPTRTGQDVAFAGGIAWLREHGTPEDEG